MSSPPRMAVFLELFIEQESWKLPPEYKDVIKKECASSPSALYLSWRTEAIPARGTSIMLDGLKTSLGHMKSGKIEEHYNFEDGIVVYVPIIPVKQIFPRSLGIYHLLALSEERFRFESERFINDALIEAHLPATAKDYDKRH